MKDALRTSIFLKQYIEDIQLQAIDEIFHLWSNEMLPMQVHNQLGTPGGAKSFLRGAHIF